MKIEDLVEVRSDLRAVLMAMMGVGLFLMAGVCGYSQWEAHQSRIMVREALSKMTQQSEELASVKVRLALAVKQIEQMQESECQRVAWAVGRETDWQMDARQRERLKALLQQPKRSEGK